MRPVDRVVGGRTNAACRCKLVDQVDVFYMLNKSGCGIIFIYVCVCFVCVLCVFMYIYSLFIYCAYCSIQIFL